MKGLIIWAQSSCRSTMGLYAELANLLSVPVKIALWHFSEDGKDIRSTVGHDSKEFEHLDFIRVGEDWKEGLDILDAHEGYSHLFAVYQASKVWRKLACEAKKRGCRVIVGSEAPCNMSKGIHYFLKELYMRFALPIKVRNVVDVADYFINYSGDDNKYARKIGWVSNKIIPFGYFPPPLKGSSVKMRKTNKPFTILSTGILSSYRGADVLVKALKLLKDRGVNYRAVITQEGELLSSLKKLAAGNNLPIEFPGFLSMDELIRLYESCSVFVASGKHEPWGMRLNDALNCGAPLVVSTGMGGVKMVNDLGCGLSFENKNPKDLADVLERLATNEDVYLECAANVEKAIAFCSPKNRATEIYNLLQG